jgi:hypothetical protein
MKSLGEDELELRNFGNSLHAMDQEVKAAFTSVSTAAL